MANMPKDPNARRRRARTAALAAVAIAVLGGSTVGPAQAIPIDCEGPCTVAPTPKPKPKPVPAKPKLVTVYRYTYAYSTPYLNARSRRPLNRGVYVATCEARSASPGRSYNNRWWSRLRDGSWVNNGDLRGGVKMGIGDCPAPRNDRAQPLPTCVAGGYQKKFLGYRRWFGVDHSILRLTWHPELCRGAGGLYNPRSNPTLERIGPGHLGLGLDLRAAERTPVGVTYRGDIRECLKGSVGYKGISFSGEGCRTVGRAQITATATARGVLVGYKAWRLRHASLGYGTWVWTNRPI